MAFLKNLSRSVGKAAEQAKFEADKLVRINKLNSEISSISAEIESATAAIGTKVIELVETGSIEIPDVGELVAQVKSLSSQLEAKNAELELARSAKFEGGEEKSQPVEEAAPLSLNDAEPLSLDDASSTTTTCPECNAAVAEGAKFCPECGHKMEAE